jgi:uncharacterized membrane protein YhaH (DUF805 family)/outer membrane protein assembly factor BamD (BamD/ComL family)
MASLADLPEIIGFFSYSRDDDEDSHNALSTIRSLIQNELRARLGRSRQSLRLWQDQEAIAPGSMWESQINTAVQQSVFFIPIITPRVINSKNCGVEFKRFLDREKELGRDDLVFPILYIDVDELQDETQWRGHSLLEVVGQRQYVDWREYRFELEGPALRRAVANLCTQISIALRRLPPHEKTEADDRAAAQKRAAERARKEHEEQESAAAERARQEEEAKKRAEQEQAFVEAKDADTVAAFSAFIAAYPGSHLAGDAQKAKARLLARDQAHGQAMASDDPIVLESFLNSYPNERHADEIRARLRELRLKADDGIRLAKQKEMRERAEQEQAFARAKDADTMAAFSAFIAAYPESHLAGDAQKAKARLLARDKPPPKRPHQPPVVLSNARHVFLNSLNFSGRSGRSEYWYWGLLVGGVSFAVEVVLPEDAAAPLAWIFILVTFLPSLAVSVRRLHDIDRTGWWMLLVVVPIFLALYKGTPGPNRFGPDPLATD